MKDNVLAEALLGAAMLVLVLGLIIAVSWSVGRNKAYRHCRDGGHGIRYCLSQI